jgi:DNA modification methylase
MKKVIYKNLFGEENKDIEENNLVKDNFFMPISVWDIDKNPKLCELVNDTEYRDVDPNKALSELNPELVLRCLSVWSKKGDRVLDPFLNRGTTPIMSAYYGRIGYGNDIVPKYVDHVQKQVNVLKEKYTWANNIFINNGNARDIIEIAKNNFNVEKFDYIITSPPFWDIEPYESVKGQLSDIQDYENFLIEYNYIIEQLYEILKPKSFITYIVNDFVKNKDFYDFSGDTKRSFKNAGFKLHDVIINYLRSPFIIRAGLAFNNEKRMIKCHEYIITARK